jgi:hypothetical protein
MQGFRQRPGRAGASGVKTERGAHSPPVSPVRVCTARLAPGLWPGVGHRGLHVLTASPCPRCPPWLVDLRRGARRAIPGARPRCRRREVLMHPVSDGRRFGDRRSARSCSRWRRRRRRRRRSAGRETARPPAAATTAALGAAGPAVPLVAYDPAFSIWSPADRLTDAATVHWTGRTSRCSLSIDGETLR